MKVCDDILTAQVDAVEFTFMGNTSYIAKATDNQFVRTDGGEGNIIYNKEQVFVKG